MNAILSTLLSPIVAMWREHEEREATRSTWAAKLDDEWNAKRKAHALSLTLAREARGDRFDWYRVDDLAEDVREIVQNVRAAARYLKTKAYALWVRPFVKLRASLIFLRDSFRAKPTQPPTS